MTITQAEVELLRAINGAGPAALEPFMHALSWLGDYWRLPLYLAVLAALVLFRALSGERAAAVAAGVVAFRLAIGVALAAAVTSTLKVAFALPRPAKALQGIEIFATPGSEFTFPSGHAAFAALVAATVWPLLPGWGRLVAVILAAGVAVSRLWLGMHFPSDVAAGLLIGLGVAAWTAWLARRWSADPGAALGLGLAGLIVALDAAADTMIAGAQRAADVPGFMDEAWQLLFVAGALLLAAWLVHEIFIRGIPTIVKLAYGSLIGGIVGGVLDRVLWSGPVDWLDLHWGVHQSPAVSAADGAVAAGAALLLYGLRRRAAPPPQGRAAPGALATPLVVSAPAALFIVFNMGSGRRNRQETLRTVAVALRAAGRPWELLSVRRASELPRAAARAVRLALEHRGAVVAAGGDGTINAVAQVAAGTGLPFGVLPLGTFNYFARDHAIPLDIPGALEVLLAGRLAPVQVGLVNERVFLVNASLGFYPRLLEDREVFKQRYGRARWIALLSALWSLAFREQREFSARVEREDDAGLMRASTLFVGNNALQLQHVGIPEASELAAGRLVAIGVRPAGRAAMLALAWRGATSSLAAAEPVFRFSFGEMQVQRVAPQRAAKPVKVAIDGETVRLAPPLIFRAAPGALWLLSPPPASTDQP